MPSLSQVYHLAKSRKLVRTAAIYFSTTMTVLGVCDLITRHYGLTTKVFDTLLTLGLCGFPSILMRVWYHTGPPKGKIRKHELAIDGVLALTALIIVYSVLGRPEILRKLPEAKSVAVLPFKNLSDSRDDEYFSDGMTEDIITQLSKIGDLKVISRTSIMSYKNTLKPIRQIGRELDVAAILEGSVRREGSRLRISGRLIDARSDRHLWADTYDRLSTDIFAIQNEVAWSIAGALKATLSTDEKALFEKKATANIDAYAYYIKGREYYYQYTREDNEKAIELFVKALELDPNYALAYAGMADAFVRRKVLDDAEKPDVHPSGFRRDGDPLEISLEYSQKAIDLDPKSAEAYKARGFAQDTKDMIPDALRSYLQAVDLNPNYGPAISNIGADYNDLWQYDEALVWSRKAVRLQPGFARYYALVALLYYQLGFDEQAVAWFEKTLEFQPDFVFPQFLLAMIDLFGGRSSVARARIAKILQTNPKNLDALEIAGDIELVGGRFGEAESHYRKIDALKTLTGASATKLALVLLKQGKADEANKILEGTLASNLKNPRFGTKGSPTTYAVAQITALQKKTAEALDWLEKAVQIGYYDRWITIDPVWDPLRPEKKFRDIMVRLGERLTGMRKRVRELGLDR